MNNKMKEQKGITLIALIITIIVMLILVVVTINMAVNGGLFANAKTGAEQTQREADKELLISAVLDSMKNDGSINTDLLQTIADELGFEYYNGEYIKRDTLNKFTVSSDGLTVEYTGVYEEPEYQYYNISFKENLSNVQFGTYFTQLANNIDNDELMQQEAMMAVFIDEQQTQGYSIGVIWPSSYATPVIRYEDLANDQYYFWVSQNNGAPTWYVGNAAGTNFSNTASTPIFSGNLRQLSVAECQEAFGAYAPQNYLTQTQLEAILDFVEVE